MRGGNQPAGKRIICVRDRQAYYEQYRAVDAHSRQSIRRDLRFLRVSHQAVAERGIER